MSRATYGAAGAIFEGSLVQLDAAGGSVVEVESFAGTAATCWVKFQSLAMRDPA